MGLSWWCAGEVWLVGSPGWGTWSVGRGAGRWGSVVCLYGGGVLGANARCLRQACVLVGEPLDNVVDLMFGFHRVDYNGACLFLGGGGGGKTCVAASA